MPSNPYLDAYLGGNGQLPANMDISDLLALIAPEGMAGTAPISMDTAKSSGVLEQLLARIPTLGQQPKRTKKNLIGDIVVGTLAGATTPPGGGKRDLFRSALAGFQTAEGRNEQRRQNQLKNDLEQLDGLAKLYGPLATQEYRSAQVETLGQRAEAAKLAAEAAKLRAEKPPAALAIPGVAAIGGRGYKVGDDGKPMYDANGFMIPATEGKPKPPSLGEQIDTAVAAAKQLNPNATEEQIQTMALGMINNGKGISASIRALTTEEKPTLNGAIQVLGRRKAEKDAGLTKFSDDDVAVQTAQNFYDQQVKMVMDRMVKQYEEITKSRIKTAGRGGGAKGLTALQQYQAKVSGAADALLRVHGYEGDDAVNAVKSGTVTFDDKGVLGKDVIEQINRMKSPNYLQMLIDDKLKEKLGAPETSPKPSTKPAPQGNKPKAITEADIDKMIGGR